MRCNEILTHVITVESFLISNKKLNGVIPALNALNLSFIAVLAHSNILLTMLILAYTFLLGIIFFQALLRFVKKSLSFSSS